MKLLTILLVLTFSVSFGQEVTLKTILNDVVEESSGLIKLDERLITFNDSQGLPQLYEINSITGEIERTVTLANANNIDWEDICLDDTYIYVGDFGNNAGSRTDLKIYKLLIEDYLASDTVWVDSVLFHYPEQTDFSSQPYATNFDAEALMSYGDSLYIFTKNWKNRQCNIYALPKTKGDYPANKVANFNPQGLITGADYNPERDVVVLSGYWLNSVFVMELSDFDTYLFSAENTTRYNITPPENTSYQVEAVCFVEPYKYYLTSESYQGKAPALIELSLNASGYYEMPSEHLMVYPNPFSDSVKITAKDFAWVDIYDSSGVLLMSSRQKVIDLKALKQSVFFLKIRNKEGKLIGSQKMVKQ